MLTASLLCLTQAVYFEGRSQSDVGQYLIAQTVLNRVSDHRYPDTVCGVVWEPKAFSFTHDGKHERMPEEESKNKAVLVASETIKGFGSDTKATHYHASYVTPYWAKYYELDTIEGLHYFYINKTNHK